MANMIQRKDPTTSMPTYGTRDPFRLMRDMLRWDPFGEMSGYPGLDLQAFSAHFDVKETKDALVIQGDLPGMSEKDVSISITGSRLTISGERKAEETSEGESYYMSERTHGSFVRTFTLPEDVEPDGVQAELKDGVLRLTVPKRPEAQPKRIQVKAGR